jgi:hypothetical protein
MMAIWSSEKWSSPRILRLYNPDDRRVQRASKSTT